MPAPSLANALNLANQYNRGDGNAGPRIPMCIWSDATTARGESPIQLRINPHAVNFKQPKRITKKQTQAGTVYMHWSDENGSNNDILELQFKGRTGNINIKQDPPPNNTFVGNALNNLANSLSNNPPGQGRTPTQGAGKLYTWARLYQLTAAPKLDFLPVGNTANVTRQDVTSYILYRSPLFPQGIRFDGFFNNVLDFGEVAEQPWLIEWSFSFVVQKTNPPLTKLTSYLNNILMGGDQAFAQTVAAGQAATLANADQNRGAQTSANFKSG
jgi:hypothetical protein